MAELSFPTIEDMDRAVRAYLERTGLPMSELSKRIFGNSSHLSDILRGRKDPRMSSVQRIADMVTPPDQKRRAPRRAA